MKTKKYNKKKYLEYLNSNEWKKIRRQKAKEQNYKCEICGVEVKKGFNIHHKSYEHLGKERMNELLFVCKDCHKVVHKLIDERKKKSGFFGKLFSFGSKKKK